jgi:membrane fusion protein, heavy metal efflux system
MKLFNIIFLGLLLNACSGGKTPANPFTAATGTDSTVKLSDEQFKNANIETAGPVWELMHKNLQVSGVVDVPPHNIVSVSFPLGGYLRSTRLLPGMPVKKGEQIAIMEDQGIIQLQQEYLVAQVRLQFLKAEYDRQKSLRENQVNSEKTLQQVTAEFESQKVLVRSYSEKLRLAGIDPEGLRETNISRQVALLSPIDGFVSRVNVNIGKFVNPSDVLFELINPNDLHAVLTVFEKDITDLRAGQRVRISFVDEPGQIYPAEILLISRNVDENRTALVHCHFLHPPRRLLPGMFLKATVEISNKWSLTLPLDALVRYGNQQYVFKVLPSNEYLMVPVMAGNTENGRVEILGDSTTFGSSAYVTRNAYSLLGKLKNRQSD